VTPCFDDYVSGYLCIYSFFSFFSYKVPDHGVTRHPIDNQQLIHAYLTPGDAIGRHLTVSVSGGETEY
jgi:hypothetical protein